MLREFLKLIASLALLAGLIYAAFLLRLPHWLGPQKWKFPHQVPVNLLELVNNDGLAWGTNPADGNFDSPDRPTGASGSAYPADSLPDTGAVFACKALPGVHFLFPSKLDASCNNVACSGQRIEVASAVYDKLYCLGAAENGRREDALMLHYEDNTEVAAPLRFSDWCEPAAFGEIEAFTFDFRYTWDAKANKSVRDPTKVHLWIQEVPLDPARKLTHITLPANSRIHIFCMTLASRGYQYPCVVYTQDTVESYASILTEEQALYVALAKDISNEKTRLERLRSLDDGRFLRESRWLEFQIQVLEGKLPTPPYHGGKGKLRGLRLDLDEVKAFLDGLLADKNPFTAKRGVMIKCFLSEIDGTLQPYSLHVPSDYTGTTAYPLVVSLHGHGWYAPLQGHPAPAIPEAIVLSPHGRGSIDYFFIAESDVLSAIHEVQRDYHIDPNRVYLTGHSMGGTGSWTLGVHFPDVFAAIAPNAGNADHKVWRRDWGWTGEPDPSPDIGRVFEGIGSFFFPPPAAGKKSEVKTIGELERYVANAADPASYAENLCNLPAYCIHGAQDEIVPVGHARSMTNRLKELGYPVRYVELPNTGHGGFPAAETKQQRDWLLEQVRNPRPAFVRFRTNKLRYPGAYWLYMDAFNAPVPFAEIEARAPAGRPGQASPSPVEVTTKNVQAFSIDLTRCPLGPRKKLQVKVDGKMAYDGDLPKLSQFRLAQGANGVWAPTERPTGRLKRAGLEGPVEDAFMSPFMLVYGTTSNSEFTRGIVQSEVERFAADWKRMYANSPRMKADADVTEEDIKKYNLILYGAPNENIVTAEVMPKLPIRIEGDKIRFGNETLSGQNLGVKFCYPNPLNEERYVVVCAGATWRALFQINNRFGNWFNWGVYDNRNWADFAVFDDRTTSTDTFLAVGFFDTHWKLDPRFVWRGDPKKREANLLRVVPESAKPPEKATQLYLSQLLPVIIDQHKGPANADRSFEGRAIHIGGQLFEHGFGIRAPSILEFDLDGRFDTLHLVAGIDLEGRDKGTPARTKFESVQFSVYGDGKRLYQSDFLKWSSKPAVADVTVSRVKRLRLAADAGGARWHLGSAAWGDMKLTKK